MNEILYIPERKLPALTDDVVYDMVEKHRVPMLYYNAKYFDEPFTAMMLSSFDNISDISFGDGDDDRNHIDIIVNINGIVYNVDVKSVQFNYFAKDKTNVDLLSIGEYVFKHTGKGLMISVIYNSKIYIMPLDEIIKCKPHHIRDRAAANGRTSQIIYYYNMNDIIKLYTYQFDIPFDMYEIYRYGLQESNWCSESLSGDISLYRQYKKDWEKEHKNSLYKYEKLYPFNANNRYEELRIKLEKCIKDSNVTFRKHQAIKLAYISTDTLEDDLNETDSALAAIGLF